MLYNVVIALILIVCAVVVYLCSFSKPVESADDFDDELNESEEDEEEQQEK